MRIQGQIDEGVLVHLLQYLNLNAATGVLHVQAANRQRGEVYTRSGQVVHANLHGSEGVPALMAILAFTSGRFAFQANIPSPRKTIDKALDALLLEIAYETDHAVDATKLKVDGETILAPASLPTNEQGRRVALPLIAIRMLPLLDGIRSLGSVARQLGADFSEVVTAAELLLENELVAYSEGRLLTADFINNLTELTRDIMGPLADIVIDDSLYELGITAASVPESRLTELLRLIEREFPSQLRVTFRERVNTLLSAHGLLSG